MPRIGVLTSSGEWGARAGGDVKTLLFGGEGEGEVMRLVFPFAVECGRRGVLWTPVALEGESIMEVSSSSSSPSSYSAPVIVMSSSSSCVVGVWKVVS